ncbi:MAG: pilus assembly protein [Rhizobiaceae bacterium]|nr:pilus assembly protein [Rhizobiaceae bacterium]
MRLALRRLATRFPRANEGAAAVEFAIVSLPFIAIVFMIFQVALYHFGLQSLDLASSAASRQIMIGKLPASAYNLGEFKRTQICPRLLMNFDCDAVIVNAYKANGPSDPAANTGIYAFINATSKTLRALPAQSTFCVGGPGDHVFLDVAYEFPNFMGSMLMAAGADPRRFMMRSTTFFRNELFDGNGQAC